MLSLRLDILTLQLHRTTDRCSIAVASRFCSTCRRVKPVHTFFGGKKTCTGCLENKRARRSRKKQPRRRPPVAKSASQKFCKSCKVHKSCVEFADKLKTCRNCLLRRMQHRMIRSIDQKCYKKDEKEFAMTFESIFSWASKVNSESISTILSL